MAVDDVKQLTWAIVFFSETQMLDHFRNVLIKFALSASERKPLSYDQEFHRYVENSTKVPTLPTDKNEWTGKFASNLSPKTHLPTGCFFGPDGRLPCFFSCGAPPSYFITLVLNSAS